MGLADDFDAWKSKPAATDKGSEVPIDTLVEKFERWKAPRAISEPLPAPLSPTQPGQRPLPEPGFAPKTAETVPAASAQIPRSMQPEQRTLSPEEQRQWISDKDKRDRKLAEEYVASVVESGGILPEDDIYTEPDPGPISPQEQAQAVHRNLREGLPGYKNALVRTIGQGLAGAGSQFASLASRLEGEDVKADEINRLNQMSEQAAAMEDKNSIINRRLLSGGRSAVNSLATMIIGRAAGLPGMIGLFTAESVNQAITDGRDAGLSGSKLVAHAATQGAIEGVVTWIFSKIGLGGVESKLASRAILSAGLKEAAKKTGKTVGGEWTEEQIILFGQSLTSSLAGVQDPMTLVHEDGSFRDKDGNFTPYIESVIDTSVAVFIMSGTVSAPDIASAGMRQIGGRKRKPLGEPEGETDVSEPTKVDEPVGEDPTSQPITPQTQLPDDGTTVERPPSEPGAVDEPAVIPDEAEPAPEEEVPAGDGEAVLEQARSQPGVWTRVPAGAAPPSLPGIEIKKTIDGTYIRFTEGEPDAQETPPEVVPPSSEEGLEGQQPEGVRVRDAAEAEEEGPGRVIGPQLPAQPEPEVPAAEVPPEAPVRSVDEPEVIRARFIDDLEREGVAVAPDGSTVKIVPDPGKKGRFIVETATASGSSITKGPWRGYTRDQAIEIAATGIDFAKSQGAGPEEAGPPGQPSPLAAGAISQELQDILDAGKPEKIVVEPTEPTTELAFQPETPEKPLSDTLSQPAETPLEPERRTEWIADRGMEHIATAADGSEVYIKADPTNEGRFVVEVVKDGMREIKRDPKEGYAFKGYTREEAVKRAHEEAGVSETPKKKSVGKKKPVKKKKLSPAAKRDVRIKELRRKKEDAKRAIEKTKETKEAAEKPVKKKKSDSDAGKSTRIGATRKKRLGSKITRSSLAKTFPGAKIKPAPNGWHVEIGDSFFTVELTDEVAPVDWKAIEASGVKVSAKLRGQIAVAGSFSLKLPDGTKHSGLGLIRLLSGLADEATLRHEALHLARQAGLLGEAEWQALVKEHAPDSKVQEIQEERVANAREIERTVPNIWGRVRSWLRRLLSSIGVTEYQSRDIHLLLGESGFWHRPAKPRGDVTVRYQLLRGRPDLANPAYDQPARDLVTEADEQRKLEGSPGVRSDIEVQANADARLKNDYSRERANLLAKGRSGRMLDDVETVIAKSIVNREAMEAIQSGDIGRKEDTIAIIESYRNTGTEQARAFRQRVDPVESPAERIARALTEAIFSPPTKQRNRRDKDRSKGRNEEADKINRDWANKFDELKKRLALLGIDINELHRLGYSRRQAARALQVISQARADGWDKVYEYWRNSILSAPTTQMANLTGNFGNAVWSLTAERLTEALANSVIGRPEGAQFGEYKHILAGLLPGLSRASRNFFITFDTETPTFEDQLGRAGKFRIEDPDTKISGDKGRTIRMPQRLLLAVDDFAKTLFATMEVGARAYRIAKDEGLSGDKMRIRMAELTDDIESPAWEAAYNSSLEMAFQQKGTQLGQKIKRQVLSGRKDVPAIRYVLPFVITPINIFETGLKKSPLGSLGIGMRMYQNYRAGEPVLKNTSREVAQQILAWGLVLLLMGNDDDDPWITGAEELTGAREVGYRTIPKQSIKFGNTWHSYHRIEPFATTLGLATDWVNAVRSDDPGRQLSTPFRSLVGQMKEKTFLTGVGDIIKAFEAEDPEEKAAQWASNFATSWVPNIIRSQDRAMDNFYYNRRVWGSGNDWWASLGKRTLQKSELPLSIQEYPIYDVWGRPAARSEVSEFPGADFLYRMFVPVKLRQEDIFIADRLLMNYNNMSPDEARYPRTPRPYYRKGRETIYMSDGQYADYVRLAGETASSALELFPLDPENPTRTDVDIIGDVVSGSRQRTRDLLVKHWKDRDGDINDVQRKLIEYADTQAKKTVKKMAKTALLGYRYPGKDKDETEAEYREQEREYLEAAKNDRDWLRKHQDKPVVKGVLSSTWRTDRAKLLGSNLTGRGQSRQIQRKKRNLAKKWLD
jgi:hypothetical protein